MPPRGDLLQGIDIPILEGTDHTPPTMLTDMGNISTSHNHTAVPTTTGAAAVSKDTHHAPHPATTVPCITLQPMDALITICTVTHLTGIVAPNPTLATSPTDITHGSTPQTGASITPATPTKLHRKNSQ